MKFSDFEYQRPDWPQIESQFSRLLAALKQAVEVEKQLTLLDQINDLRKELETAFNLCEIRFTLNADDPFYKNEIEIIDQMRPKYENIINQYYAVLDAAKNKNDLEKKIGAQIFKIARVKLNAFQAKIMPDMEQENELVTQYNQLKAKAKIHFKDQELNLSQILTFFEDPDRETRKQAFEANSHFYCQNASQLGAIFDQLVQLRTNMATRIGYKNFIQMAYDRLLRTDYNAENVALFRKQVKDEIVPLTLKIREKQARRIKIPNLKYYDLPYFFTSGNPKPEGSTGQLESLARKMYHQLSPETGRFIDFMLEHQLLDLEARAGKMTGGYCEIIAGYQSPFIFANFNGTFHDIGVLTHEAGHAFQAYLCRNEKLIEYTFPTLESCEIHSMSMEFFTWPWMKYFFSDQIVKFQYHFLADSLLYIPYEVAVDQFQHYVYENPDLSIRERNLAWRKIEQEYMPAIDYDGNQFLEEGGYWYKQSHIFSEPFYYIDYALAQFCAYQYWNWMNEDQTAAWQSYFALCREGGKKSFLELLKLAGLKSPFEPGVIRQIKLKLEDWLDQVDDQKF